MMGGNQISFEAYVSYAFWHSWSKVFDFGNGDNNDNIYLSSYSTHAKYISFHTFDKTKKSSVFDQANAIEESEWAHIVITDNNGFYTLWINGRRIKSK